MTTTTVLASTADLDRPEEWPLSDILAGTVPDGTRRLMFAQYDLAAAAVADRAAINAALPAGLTLDDHGQVHGPAEHAGVALTVFRDAIAAVDGPDGLGFWRIAEQHKVTPPVDVATSVDALRQTLHTTKYDLEQDAWQTGAGMPAYVARIRALMEKHVADVQAALVQLDAAAGR